MIDWSIDWLRDFLSYSQKKMKKCLLVACLTDCITGWRINGFDWLIDRLIDMVMVFEVSIGYPIVISVVQYWYYIIYTRDFLCDFVYIFRVLEIPGLGVFFIPDFRNSGF